MHRLIPAIVALLALLAAGPAAADRGSSFDTVVVGAGPGGLMAALQAHAELRAQGKTPKVMVVEKRGPMPKGARFDDKQAVGKTAFARQQIIGLKPQVLADLAELGVKIPDRYRIREMRSVATDGDALRQPTTKPDLQMSPEVSTMVGANSTHVIRINELQGMLTDAAKKRGIKVAFNTGIDSLTQNGKSVSLGLQTARGETKVRSRWVIGADGAGSKTRGLAGIQWMEGKKQGHMVGVWFKGIRGNNRIVYPKAPGPGNSGVLLGDRSQVYGLFALPSHLGNLLEKARAQQRPLTSPEQSKIMKHCEQVAKKMLSPREAAQVKADYMLSFPIALNRARSAVNGRVVIAGDAVQTVNPYTGMGANVSMQIAKLAARAVVAADGAGNAGAARRLLATYSRQAVGAAKAMHNLCMPLKLTFRSPSRQLKQRLRTKTQTAAKKVPTKTRRAPARSRQRNKRVAPIRTAKAR